MRRLAASLATCALLGVDGLAATVGAVGVGAVGVGAVGALAGGAVVAPPLAAQPTPGPRLVIGVPDGTRPATVRLTGALADGDYDELLRNGFDVRVHVRAELWRVGRWFDDLQDRTEWDLVVHFDQLDRTYAVARLLPDGRVTPLGTYGRLDAAAAALALPYVPRLRAPAAGSRWYYAVRADVSVLDFDDVDEVRRWLGGELEPAVRGEKSAGTALTRGVQALVSRLLGGSVRRIEARSPRFRVRGTG